MSKPQRPKTGFKQKNLGDLQKVSFDEIEKYADLLYEEKYEEKITGARNILFLIREPENMFLILQDKSNLLDILSRTLRDEHKKNMELSIYLLTFFESFSYYNEFHQFLVQQSIGEICLSIIDWNFMKYEYRKDEMIRWSSSDSISKIEYQKAMDRKDANLTMQAVTIKDFTANRYTGTIPGTEMSGIIVIFKIRDKTAILQTDSTFFEQDFNTLLETITFNA